MHKLSLKKIFLLVMVILPLSVWASPASEQLTTILTNLHTMQAQFNQVVQDGHGQILQQSSGQMALSRPGKFRWDTQKPSHQLLIADGQKIWFYDQELQQVTLQNQHKAHSSSPAMLLDGSTTSLTKDFIVNSVANSGSVQTYKLTPRSKNSLFQLVYLSFKQNQLQQMRLLDNLGQETIVNFSQVKTNASLGNNLFRFVAPKGVDVVTQ